MIYVLILLVAALITSTGYLYLIKNDLKNVKYQLEDIQQKETNARLNTHTFDKQICDLAITVNDILENHKAEILRYHHMELQTKREFTNISHDLRTPLTSALGYLQLIQQGGISVEKQKEYLQIVEGKLKSLSSLIGNVFEYTQIQESHNVSFQKINICNLLRSILADVYADFMQNGFEVQVDIPETPVYWIADEKAVRRIFQNLIQNALVHGCGYFRVGFRESDQEILFVNKVKEGSNIQVDHLFDRFYTSDVSRTGKSTGLGLSIVKTLVEGMGGKVTAILKEELLSIIIRK